MLESAADGFERIWAPAILKPCKRLGNLAAAYLSAGKFRDAIALFERVRDAMIAKFGPDHPKP